jgi:hypothetical protein
MPYIHFDEAKRAAEQAVASWLATAPAVEKVLLVRDLFGKFRLAIWTPGQIETAEIARRLAEQCDGWWTGEVLHLEQSDEVTRKLYDDVAAQARPVGDEPRLLVLDRHRTRTGWFVDENEPLWPVPEAGPPIIVFYSFKGGLGRSTCLAALAIQRARAGERVCVLDLDLDSPGIGRLVAADSQGLTASWGVVDYLVEQAPPEAPLADYYHRCDRVAGSGELIVFPAGRVDEAYADKLARVDMEDSSSVRTAALGKLLERVRDELKPHWVLMDARTGLSDSAGRLLSGLAHLHVLLGTTQDQSWHGLNRVLDRLGKDRVERGLPQHEVLMVQAMVPVGGEAGRFARDGFLARAEREFGDRYYAEAGQDDAAEFWTTDDTRYEHEAAWVFPDDAAGFWTTDDMDSRVAPHVPVAIDYEQKLADFADIEAVADLLCGGSYAELATRIVERFEAESNA